MQLHLKAKMNIEVFPAHDKCLQNRHSEISADKIGTLRPGHFHPLNTQKTQKSIIKIIHPFAYISAIIFLFTISLGCELFVDLDFLDENAVLPLFLIGVLLVVGGKGCAKLLQGHEHQDS